MEESMIQRKTTTSAPIWRRQPGFVAAFDNVAPLWRVQAASTGLLRLMILVLVGLLFVLIGVVVVTEHVEIGGSIIGGVLFIGFTAAQFGR
jgi:hypothetical protein